MPPDRQLRQGRRVADRHAQTVHDHGRHHAARQAADAAGNGLLRADRRTELRSADRATHKQCHHVSHQRYREGQAQQHNLHRLLVRNHTQGHQAQSGQRHRQQRQRAHAQVRQFRLLPEQDFSNHRKQRHGQQRYNHLHAEQPGQRHRGAQDHPGRPGNHLMPCGHQRVIFFPHRKADADQCRQRHAPVRQPQVNRQKGRQHQTSYKPLFHPSYVSCMQYTFIHHVRRRQTFHIYRRQI